MRATAPEKVTLYNFNEETGVWENYGEATKIETVIGPAYKASVTSLVKPWFKIAVLK